MNESALRIVTAAVLGLAACGGTTATADTASQSQAQSTSANLAEAASDRPPHPPHPPAPPEEAFAACASKSVGEACSVTFGSETIAGTCVTPPDDAPDTRIVCRPDKPPTHGPHGRRPPPEVLAACDGKAVDAACTVAFGDRIIAGTCKAPPPGVDETRLGCAPARPDHHPAH